MSPSDHPDTFNYCLHILTLFTQVRVEKRQEGGKGEDKTRKEGEREGEESETGIFQRDETKERAMGG